jgi:hypothetical protein
METRAGNETHGCSSKPPSIAKRILFFCSISTPRLKPAHNTSLQHLKVNRYKAGVVLLDCRHVSQRTRVTGKHGRMWSGKGRGRDHQNIVFEPTANTRPNAIDPKQNGGPL